MFHLAYINKYSSLVPWLATTPSKTTPPSDPPSPEQTSKAMVGVFAPIVDNTPLFMKFGQILTDVKNVTFHAGNTPSALFVAANPRNNLRLEGTFMTVDRLVSGSWVPYKSG